MNSVQSISEHHPNSFFEETDKLMLNSYVKIKGPRITKIILEKQKLQNLYFSTWKLSSYLAVLWCSLKEKQWNRTENLKSTHISMVSWFFKEGTKTNRKRAVFSKMAQGQLNIYIHKKNESGSLPHIIYNNSNSKILFQQLKILKLSEENKGMSMTEQEKTGVGNKLVFTKIKAFHASQNTTLPTKKWKDDFMKKNVNHVSNKKCVSKIKNFQ